MQFSHIKKTNETACSHADLADLRREKTGWADQGNGSAKADTIDHADKDSCDIERVYVVCSLSAGDNVVFTYQENKLQ